MSKKLTVFILANILFLGAFLRVPHIALASRLYTTPFSQTFEKDTTQTIEVRLDTQGQDVNALSSYITYPTDVLEVSSINSTATFDIAAEETVDGNTIKISRGVITPVNGDVLVATITFKAKDIGTGSLEFTSDSAVPNAVDNTDTLTSTNGSPVNITEQASVAPDQPDFMSILASMATAVSNFLFA